MGRIYDVPSVKRLLVWTENKTMDDSLDYLEVMVMDFIVV